MDIKSSPEGRNWVRRLEPRNKMPVWNFMVPLALPLTEEEPIQKTPFKHTSEIRLKCRSSENQGQVRLKPETRRAFNKLIEHQKISSNNPPSDGYVKIQFFR
ncbi:hypothetical protein CEXT_216181 [Caerostris extrusa]|uniref:Uncharacterized protein n=1 Tax=Caerostris extrusa TaxID=172846 RepID=A0AAV4XVI3_CAEEX|nr:hypothetical protein CEXT_216181 [Caerostris extrusa]